VGSRASKPQKNISLATVNHHRSRQQQPPNNASKQSGVHTVVQSASGASTTFVHSVSEALTMSSGPKTLTAASTSDKLLVSEPSCASTKRNVANDDKVL
jgi:hypothetical protein